MGGSEVLDNPWVYGEFEADLSYVRPCFRRRRGGRGGGGGQRQSRVWISQLSLPHYVPNLSKETPPLLISAATVTQNSTGHTSSQHLASSIASFCFCFCLLFYHCQNDPTLKTPPPRQMMGIGSKVTLDSTDLSTASHRSPHRIALDQVSSCRGR